MPYLYRALNDSDKKTLQQYGEIRASGMGKQGLDILQDIPVHIAKASNVNSKDCWISTCKNIYPCIAEYSLPQGGRYNTASGRKDIAVMDLSHWKTVKNPYECYTIFKNHNDVIVDFEKYTQYLPSKKDLMAQTRTSKMTQHEYRYKLVQFVRSCLEKQPVTDALFDCSFIRKPCADINRMDIMSFSSNEGSFRLFDRGLTAINNGITQKATEVLCFDKIPQSAIKTILTPVQQDVIYMAETEGLQNKIIEGLVAGNISIQWTGSDIEVGVNYDKARIHGKPWMYPGLIYEYLTAQDDVEEKYQDYVQEKKNTVRKALLFILNEWDEKVSTFLLPEENDLRVLDCDKNTYSNLRKTDLYDTVAIKYKGRLYTINKTSNNPTDLIGTISKGNELIRSLEQDNKINSIF